MPSSSSSSSSSSVVGSRRPLQDWGAAYAGAGGDGWMQRKEGPKDAEADTWMELGPSSSNSSSSYYSSSSSAGNGGSGSSDNGNGWAAAKVADEHSRRGGLRAPTFTASMVPGGGGSSVRSERSSIWAMPVNGTPATAATTNRSHHAPRHGPYSTATTTAAGGAGGAGAAPSRSLPTNSNHKSKLSPTVLERIAQNKARALALRANKGKKMIY